MQKTCGRSETHEDAKNFEVFPGKILPLLMWRVCPASCHVSCRGLPGRMRGQTGPFGIEPKEGKEEYKSPST